MFVKNHMLEKKKLTTVSLEETLNSALEKIKEGDFLSLPVLEGDQFKGYIMKEAIYRAYFDQEEMTRDNFLQATIVKDIYNEKFNYINENSSIDEGAYLLRELSTPFIPVFGEDKKFKGILTHVAIFNAFSEIFGLGKGTKIVINSVDLPGRLAKLTEVMRKEKANIINLAIVDTKVLDIMKIVLRVETNNINRLVREIEEAGFKIDEVTN